MSARVKRVVFWGTYDLGKPRTRILIRGLREAGIEVDECHAEVWGGVNDKTTVKGTLQRFRLVCKWLLSYPSLIFRYLCASPHDAVLVGYLGHLDVIILWMFARIRRVPIVWDAFLSLYDTIVEDRKLVSHHHPLARLLFWWEWLACRAAALVLLDTEAHAEYFIDRYGVGRTRVGAVFVGAESEVFVSGMAAHRSPANKRVLFYGQFIPLHGIETIVRAARLARNVEIDWILIGSGQEEERIREMLTSEPLPRLRWIPWVQYEELAKWIQEADVCLGIFGATEKAGRVIPNKVFQILAAGKPLITRDSPALRELVSEDQPGIFLIPPADERALLEAVERCGADGGLAELQLHTNVVKRFGPEAIGKRLVQLIDRVRIPPPKHSRRII